MKFASYFLILYILGAFAKLRSGTVSFVKSVCPHGITRLPIEGFSWNLIFEYLWEICREIQVSLKCGNYNGYFTWIPIYFVVSRSDVLRVKNFSLKSRRDNQNTHFIFHNFFFRKSCHVWDNVKNRGRQATDDNMVHAHCMLDTQGYTHTHTHSEYVILPFHYNSGTFYIHCMSCYTLPNDGLWRPKHTLVSLLCIINAHLSLIVFQYFLICMSVYWPGNPSNSFPLTRNNPQKMCLETRSGS